MATNDARLKTSSSVVSVQEEVLEHESNEGMRR
jgi:hypothetical protein